VKTLRYYDKLGLLKPAFIDSNTGYRYYTDEQISQIYAILSYKKAGLSGEEMKQLLSKEYSQKELLQICKARLEKERVNLSEQISHIDTLLKQAESEENGIVVKTVPEYTSCCCCGYVKDVSHIPAFMKNCHLEIRRLQPDVRFAEPDYCCVIYPQEEYREKDIFIEYAQAVQSFDKQSEIVKIKKLEEVKVVSVTHYGKYETLSSSYLKAVEWAAKNGYILRGDVRERYIHGSWDHRQENQWETEVQLPIKEKR
ncbi:MAG: MerR family transcriptional regulator, partial [Clostridia bacterium]|nr:MerR family transcriptional regulator [Clostridia bacterium]